MLRATTLAGAPNAIESIEVRDHDEPQQFLRQRTLFVRCVRPIAAALGVGNVRIDGGTRVRSIPVAWAARADAYPPALSPTTTELVPTPAEWQELVSGIDPAELASVLVVRTDARGDFSPYRLRLVAGASSDAPPPGFDHLLASIEFAFKVECESDVDCSRPPASRAERQRDPDIDYVAKDYEGFRRVMLDRMSRLAPEWIERSPADLGVMLVEALAYLADQLSYRQDAIATEAYLATARSRISLRRHARLVDYRVHEGENARAWVRVGLTGTVPVRLEPSTVLGTRVPGLPDRIATDSDDERRLLAESTIFETVDAAVLHPDLAELEFYTWGEQDAGLEAGATTATLRGRHPGLRVGDALMLTELVPVAPLEPLRKIVVRLVSVRPDVDPTGGLFSTPPVAGPTDVTEIGWHLDDALPFPLRIDSAESPVPLGVARGNLVLADHGRSIAPAQALAAIGPAPHAPVVAGDSTAGSAGCDCGCGGEAAAAAAARYLPRLAHGPLTRRTVQSSEPFATLSATGAAGNALRSELDQGGAPVAWRAVLDDAGVRLALAATITGRGGAWTISDRRSAVQVLLANDLFELHPLPGSARSVERSAPSDARPAIHLVDDAGETWLAREDLLASGPDDPHFVVETEHDGTAMLRFSRGANGRIPDAATAFTAQYRVGNGAMGRIGSGALAHVVSDDTAVAGVENELPSFGAVEPESREEIVRDAPEAFRVQERAVTDADYVELAGGFPTVQRCAVTRRWTGSWLTVFVSADRTGGIDVDAEFEAGLRTHLEPYRLAGVDLEVDGARNVPIEVVLTVCAAPDHAEGDVRAGVADALSSGVRPNGTPGLFHPDRRTLGEPVRISDIIAAAQAVPGVVSVEVSTFRRLRRPDTSGLDTGRIDIDRLEVARLDDDPNFPDLGVLTVDVRGGR